MTLRTSLLVMLFLVLLFMPFAGVTAQTVDPILGGPLVPCNGIDCDICDLTKLADNIIDFAVAFTIFVAILLFVYAGFLYIGAQGDPGKVKSAHNIFRTVLIGMIIVLAAWLIVDVVMSTFLNKKFGPWNDIICDGSSRRSSSSSDANPNSRVDVVVASNSIPEFPAGYEKDPRTAEQKINDEQALRDLVSNFCSDDDLHCTAYVARGSCALDTATGVGARCTDISRLDGELFNVIEATALECGASELSRSGLSNARCSVVVTGGSELGVHGTDSGCIRGAGTHCAGDKIDVDDTGAVNRYVQDDTYFRDPTDADKARQSQCARAGVRVQLSTGACWVFEGSHYDIARDFSK